MKLSAVIIEHTYIDEIDKFFTKEQHFHNAYDAIKWINEYSLEIEFECGIIYFDEPIRSLYREDPPSGYEIEFKDFDKFIEALNRYDAG